MGTQRTLRILQNEILGKGGYGFVCKGELISNDINQEVYNTVEILF